MALPILALAALALWAWWTGRLQRLQARTLWMAGLALIGAYLLVRGRSWIGGGLVVAAVIGWLSRKPKALPIAAEEGDLAAARDLLGLPDDYDEDMIREAHHRLMRRVHPDSGGTDALAQKINEARNILLRHYLDNSGPRR